MARSILVWTAVSAAVIVPIVIAATSPQLAWREPIYIAAGFAGILALGLLLLQPILALGMLPGLPARQGRRLHVIVGTLLVATVMLHVAGLWVTSPPDVVDALLFRSPTPFAVWGVAAMWAVLVAAILATFRRRLRLSRGSWRLCHLSLAVVIIVGSVAHAMLIEGTMEIFSKTAICVLVVLAAARAVFEVKPWSVLLRQKQ